MEVVRKPLVARPFHCISQLQGVWNDDDIATYVDKLTTVFAVNSWDRFCEQWLVRENKFRIDNIVTDDTTDTAILLWRHKRFSVPVCLYVCMSYACFACSFLEHIISLSLILASWLHGWVCFVKSCQSCLIVISYCILYGPSMLKASRVRRKSLTSNDRPYLYAAIHAMSVNANLIVILDRFAAVWLFHRLADPSYTVKCYKLRRRDLSFHRMLVGDWWYW